MPVDTHEEGQAAAVGLGLDEVEVEWRVEALE